MGPCRKRLLSALVLTCTIWLCACSTVKISTTAHFKPVVDLKKHSFTKLAVLPFRGRSGEAVSTMMQSALAEWGYYELVERHSLQTIIDELALQQQGLFAAESGAKVGELLGASHVLLGDVTACEADVGSETRYRTVKVQTGTQLMTMYNPDGSAYQIPMPVYEDRREPYAYYTMSAQVSVSFRIAAAATAALAHSKNISRSFNDGSADRSRLPTESGVLSDLAQAACNEFRTEICPYRKRITKTFLKPDSSVSESEDDAERGLKLIAAGDLEGAEEALRSATELDSRHGTAWFNLAMVLALQARAAEACPLVLKAVRLDPDNKTIIEGKQWIESLPR